MNLKRSIWAVADRAQSLFKLILQGKTRQATLSAYVEILRTAFTYLPDDGVDVASESWDVLVILDACRYDYFERLNRIDGTLEKRTSAASSTSEWVTTNFTERHEEIVYVSANPRISDTEVDGFKGTDHFHDVINVWKSDWDPGVNTVRPEPVTDAALRARRDYPDKRLIVHYIQPHAPWIGETSLSDRETEIADPTPSKWIGTGKTWGTMLNEGKSFDVVKKAYADNLQLVLDDVERLVDALPGRVVVTADHGECFGEKYIIEHPSGIYTEELVEVPWLINEDDGQAFDDERIAILESVRNISTEGL